MESSYLVIFSTAGKFITKFNVLRCINLSETLFWTGARGRTPTLIDKQSAEQSCINLMSMKNQEENILNRLKNINVQMLNAT